MTETSTTLHGITIYMGLVGQPIIYSLGKNGLLCILFVRYLGIKGDSIWRFNLKFKNGSVFFSFFRFSQFNHELEKKTPWKTTLKFKTFLWWHFRIITAICLSVYSQITVGNVTLPKAVQHAIKNMAHYNNNASCASIKSCRINEIFLQTLIH